MSCSGEKGGSFPKRSRHPARCSRIEKEEEVGNREESSQPDQHEKSDHPGYDGRADCPAFPVNPNPEAQSLFCTAYGAIIAYFFTKRSTASSGEQTGQSKEKQEDNVA